MAAGRTPENRQDHFIRLVEEYQDAAFGYAYALLRDPHLAQDATQEAFFTAYRQLGQLRDPAAFPFWLRRIVRTHCGRLRRERKLLLHPLHEALGQEETGHGARRSEDTRGDPSAAAETSELNAAVRLALAFWFLRIENALLVFLSFWETGRWPVQIYPPWLRGTLTALVPVAFATTVPAEALRSQAHAGMLVTEICFAAALLAGSRWLWLRGLKNYSGASA